MKNCFSMHNFGSPQKKWRNNNNKKNSPLNIVLVLYIVLHVVYKEINIVIYFIMSILLHKWNWAFYIMCNLSPANNQLLCDNNNVFKRLIAVHSWKCFYFANCTFQIFKSLHCSWYIFAWLHHTCCKYNNKYTKHIFPFIKAMRNKRKKIIRNKAKTSKNLNHIQFSHS